MNLLATFAIALALTMDAFAVSLTTGVRLARITPFTTLRMSCVFGAFQFLMPVAGWLLGIKAHKYIKDYDHWLAFALLTLVALNMLKEAWQNRGKTPEPEDCKDPTKGCSLWILGIATSLDALAVGLSLAMLKVDVWMPAVIIGIVCFTITALGLLLGALLRRLPGFTLLGNKANALGGLILLAIGVNILCEHGVF